MSKPEESSRDIERLRAAQKLLNDVQAACGGKPTDDVHAMLQYAMVELLFDIAYSLRGIDATLDSLKRCLK